MQSPARCLVCSGWALSQSPPQMNPSWWYHSGSSSLASMPKKRPGIVAGLGHRLAGFRVHQRNLALGIHGVALAVPLGRDRVVDVVAVRPRVVAEIARVGAVVYPALLGALRHVVLDGQVVDPHLAADAVLAGMVDDDVLDDLDAAGVRRVDEILIGGVGAFEPGIDPRPVEGVIPVIVEAAAVFHRRGDPDGGEAEIADVVETLDQPLEVAAPVRVLGLAGRGVELDAVAAKEIVGRVAVVEPRREQKVDGFLAEVERRAAGRRLGRAGGSPACSGRRFCPSAAL